MIVVGLLFSPAWLQAADTEALVAVVQVIPRQNQWSLIPPQQHGILQEVVRMEPPERHRLIREGSAVERGIGIFVVEQQGDIEQLLSLREMLETKEVTIPYALPTARLGQYARADQTVAEYLSSVYLEWFGVDVDESRKRFDRLLGTVTEPEHLVNPWIVRLRRVRNDPKETAELKKRIAVLPEKVRWAVITMGYKCSLYTEEESRGLLSQLSMALQQSIRDRESLLADTPMLRMNDGLMGATLLNESNRLMQAPGNEQP